MSGFNFRGLTFMLFIAILVWCSSMNTCIARRGRHWRQNRAALYKKKAKNHGGEHSHHNGGSKTKPPSHKVPYPPPPKKDAPPPPSTTTFNVLNFGAKGDGKSDDTKAFEAAWAAACKVEASTMLVPAQYEFLVGPVSFSGP